MKMRVSSLLVLCLAIASVTAGQTKDAAQKPQLPYSPSFNLSSLDRIVEPCVDFYHYACGGWQKNNPIPPDQTSWSVYGKLYQDNLDFLHAILEQAAAPSSEPNQVTREIGDYYAACMDEALVEKRGNRTAEGTTRCDRTVEIDRGTVGAGGATAADLRQVVAVCLGLDAGSR
jgi:putative endopeptidase